VYAETISKTLTFPEYWLLLIKKKVRLYNTNEHPSLTCGILRYLKSLTRTYTTKKVSTIYFSWYNRNLL